LEDTKIFLTGTCLQFPELKCDEWLQKFCFMLDVTPHLNRLNKKPPGEGNTALSFLEEVYFSKESFL